MTKLKLIKRTIKYWFQRRTRGWSDDETWNLDYRFFKWINTRFKAYKEQSTIVDLSHRKFEFKEKIYTQGELIDECIILSDYLSKCINYFDLKFDIAYKDLFEILEKLLPSMRW